MIQDSKPIEHENINKNLLLHSNYQLIRISGEDAGKFLQAQLTCDVNNINEQPTLGAICNIQGRVECIFKIYKLNNIFYMRIIKELLAQTIQNLRNYILRSKVILQTIDRPAIKSASRVFAMAVMHPKSSQASCVRVFVRYLLHATDTLYFPVLMLALYRVNAPVRNRSL